MAVVKNLMLRAGADFSQITKQVNVAKAGFRGMRSSVSESCSGMEAAVGRLNRTMAALGATLSVASVVAFARSAREAYEEDAEAQAKLARVMRNTMEARNADIKSVRNLISAQERLGVISDGVQTAGAQELATYLTQTYTLRKLIPVMNDMVAQQYGYNATAENAVGIATMLGKVMSGQVSGLSRYGYYFTEAQERILKYGTEAYKAKVLAEVVTASVGGMNAALAATPTGRMQQLNNEMQAIKANFGQAVTMLGTAFLPTLHKIASALAVVASLANRVAQSIANVFGGKVSKSSNAAVSYGTAGAEAMEELTAATEGAGKAAKKLGTAGFDTLQKINGASDSSGGGSGGAADVGGEVYSPVGGFSEDTEEAVEGIGWLEKRLEQLRTPLGYLRGYFGALGELFQALEPYGKALWDNVLGPMAGFAWNGFLTELRETTDLMNDMADLLSGKTNLGEFLGQLTPIQTVLVTLAATLLTIKAITAFSALPGILADLKALYTLLTGPLKLLTGITAVIGGVTLAVTNLLAMAESGFSWGHEALMLLGIAITAVGAIVLGAPALVAGVIAGIVAAVATLAVLINQYYDQIVAVLDRGFALWASNLDAMLAELKSWVSSIWSVIAGLVKVLKGILTGDLRSIGEGIKQIFTGTINAIISGLNVLIRGVNDVALPLRALILAIGKVSGKDWTLSSISIPTIPRLAAGAVIPPNREFAAILGDQRSGLNIETPERLLRQIFREESRNGRLEALLEELINLTRAGRTLRAKADTFGRYIDFYRDDKSRVRG